MGCPVLTSEYYADLARSEFCFSYPENPGGLTVTAVLPDSSTQVVDKYADGSIRSVTGSAVVAKYFDHGVSPDGLSWTLETSVQQDGPEWILTCTDGLGRAISEERPAFGGGTIVTSLEYNQLGQLHRISSTGKASVIFEYDALGNRVRSALDLNGNGVLDTASADRVKESDSAFTNENGASYLVTTDSTYDDTGTAVVTGTARRQLTGLGGSSSRTISTDIHGNQTVSTLFIDRSDKKATMVVTHPGSDVDETAVYVNGLQVSEKSSRNIEYMYSYDGIGRLAGRMDPRTGTTGITYYPSGEGKAGRIWKVTDPANNATTYDYYSTGWLAWEENTLGRKVNYAYNARGQITSVTGTASYPLDYVYDSYGRMTQLKTYRDASPDITTWAYDDATGLLSSKTYADSKSVAYEYSSDGKLKSRTWARGANTGYSYNAAGDLLKIDYSDTTPDVSFTYNRIGQKLSVTDAAGTRTYAYNGKFQQTSESSLCARCNIYAHNDYSNECKNIYYRLI